MNKLVDFIRPQEKKMSADNNLNMKTKLLYVAKNARLTNHLFNKALIDYWKKSFVWTGRASVADYWYPVLFNCAISAILSTMTPLLGILFSIIIFIPSLSVSIRRLHDINLSASFSLSGYLCVILLCSISIIGTTCESLGIEVPLFTKYKSIIYALSGFSFITFSIIFTILMLIPGTRGVNKYGQKQ